ncbi:TonB-dependent receptor [Acidomonas methanolica]|uniref:TonB-dependent ferric iron siderophore receptor n=1 Tax=Acidomonas methanolica NBRC 104435 TaxID=1231351 RepID=A0A023D1A5_ACIMT|nr:TonB-dependent receptor [Acidomonas methanolica]MBU2652798.1 TonB-dependent receptor [Acidomonas methanolica]TCS31202.1 iron complex outermembrane receptor protein [Acidomonas methanolica]GAJ27912.1 TonB-dependent ferric iron siderophore receptor [Acidomonas methanolica NBRC 104435]GBQ50836.1 TonB-dependent ferric iron siderophore receptor [Acidomonas methanolica]GEK98551.1 ligand-gated channel [Acidomonas methanolica NBRC 104435]
MLFAHGVLAAEVSAPPEKTAAKPRAARKPVNAAPIAGTLDGSNGETMVVHGRHVADGTAARYMNKTIYLGPLGNRDTLDTPYSVMGVPHDVVVNQQLRNINDMAQYLPSVQLEIRGDPNISRPQSRGFEADIIANSRLDGLNVVSTTPYPAEWVDNLQVLNGLAAAMYGPENPAGVFEYTLKRPTDRRTERLSVGVDSIGTPLVNGDISGRVGRKGWFGYRLNMLHADGTSYASGSWLRREMVSGDFDIHLDDRTVIEIDASHYTYDARGLAPGFGIPAGTAANPTGIGGELPEAPDLGRRLAPGWSGYNMETNTYLAKIRHEFSRDWSFTLGGLYQDALRQSFGISDTLTARGGTDGFYASKATATTTADDFRVGSNMAYVNGRVYTGPVRHDLVIGTNGYMMGNYNPVKAVTPPQSLGTYSLYGPAPMNGRQPYYEGRYKSSSIVSQSFIVGDTLTFDRHWSIMGTLAWSWIDQHGALNARSALRKTFSANAAFSPTTSVMYKPTDNQTFYFTYGRSVEAGPVTPNSQYYTNTNIALPIGRAEEYEVGYKLRYQKMQVNIDGFRMTSPYAMYVAAANGTCAGGTTCQTYTYGGTQRNYGVEAQISGEVLPRLSVLAGMTWLDAELVGSRTAAYDNKEIVGAAPLQASMLLDYRLPSTLGAFASGWAFNAGVHYTGNRAANVTNTLHTGSYTTLELGTRYAFHVVRSPWVARFGVSNVTNERYWASVYTGAPSGISGASSSLYAGLPRVYHFTLSAEF